MNVNSSSKHYTTVLRVAVILALSLTLLFMQSSTILADYAPVSNASLAAYSGIPTTSIKSVESGVSVTVTTYNFPADEDFTVYMGPFGTRGIGGYVVGTFYSAAGGSFELTFDIPVELVDEYMIAIRLQTADGYYYAYDWFYNNPPYPIPGYTGYPTTTILSAVEKTSVEVKVFNLPEDVDFDVTIGEFGTRGIGGVQVANFNSGVGGTQTFTFDVPAALAENYMLSIRIDSGIWYAYDWWINNSDGVAEAGYTGYPTTTILSAVEKTSVEVQVFNLPENVDFNVTIGEFGTRGIGGTLVASFNSGAGGTQTFTFDVPAALAENYKLAIRIDSGIYYAFDWWVNNPAASSTTTTTTSSWSAIPSTSFVSLNGDGTVTFMAYNFEPGTVWQVTMGAFGTRGIDGTFVQTFTSVEGSFTVTSEIPPDLVGLDQIAIRYEQVDGPYYAFDWFYN